MPRTKTPVTQALTLHEGRDEMNLADLPFASLRARGDTRKAITYKGWTTDKHGNRFEYRWVVSGSTTVGLPTEFDERTYAALMKVTKDSGFKNRRVTFSVYQLAKIMRLGMSKRTYAEIELSLKRLVGVTFNSEQAFWDNGKAERVTTAKAFHLLDEFWLRYKETNERIKRVENAPGYIIWGETIWSSIAANYIKSLDLDFFYSLDSPTARRLYRLLDKRLWDKTDYEFDIFDLSGRLGMVSYRFPAKVIEKLQPAFDELIARGFLSQAEVVKVRGYTRVHFAKALKFLPRRMAEIWQKTLETLEQEMSRATFQTWMSRTQLLNLEAG